MNDIAGIPYLEVEFDKDGNQLNERIQISEDTTDVYVISHGWNNSRQAAQNLYRDFFTNFKEVVPSRSLGNRELTIIGIIWPSKEFDELVAVEDERRYRRDREHRPRLSA